jgi:hypothetical protein
LGTRVSGLVQVLHEALDAAVIFKSCKRSLRSSFKLFLLRYQESKFPQTRGQVVKTEFGSFKDLGIRTEGTYRSAPFAVSQYL